MRSDFARLALLLALSGVVSLAGAQQVSVAASASVAAVAPGSLQAIVHNPVVLRGTLGSNSIQLSLKPKKDEDGFEGTYFIFGQSAQILLAGEVDENALSMEESQNGKDVSGQWEGSFDSGVLSGTWSSFDGAVTKPFSLKISAP